MTKTAKYLSDLKKLSRQTMGVADVLVAREYMPNAEDRAVGVIEATKVEDSLVSAIRRKFVELIPSEDDELFSGTAPISTFSAKIKICYAMGIIGKNTRRDLEIIRHIRNAFAHSAKPLWFSTPEISKACDMLTTHLRTPNVQKYRAFEQPIDSPRRQFIAASGLIQIAFLSEELSGLASLDGLDIAPLD